MVHIKLTVRDLAISTEFYTKLPGFKVVAERDDFVMLSNNSLTLGLITHKVANSNIFDEKNVGLDHFAFELESFDALNEAIEFLDKQNIEHSPIQKLSNNTHIIVFRDPDNIQLEFAFRSN